MFSCLNDDNKLLDPIMLEKAKTSLMESESDIKMFQTIVASSNSSRSYAMYVVIAVILYGAFMSE